MKGFAQFPGQQTGLVVAALSQALGMQRHRYQDFGRDGAGGARRTGRASGFPDSVQVPIPPKCLKSGAEARIISTRQG